MIKFLVNYTSTRGALGFSVLRFWLFFRSVFRFLLQKTLKGLLKKFILYILSAIFHSYSCFLRKSSILMDIKAIVKADPSALFMQKISERLYPLTDIP